MSAPRRHRRTALICAGVFAGMLGLSYASVPLYDLFCRVTGYGGTPQRAATAPDAGTPDDGRRFTIRFNADTARGLPWRFEPTQRSVTVAAGVETLATYRVTNKSDRAIVGTAVFNVTPEKAGAYFDKVACFCFEKQRLEPGQTADLPVSFFVDPAILRDRKARDVGTITLSYTFFEAPPEKTATLQPSNLK